VRQICKAKPRTQPDLTRRPGDYAAGYADGRVDKPKKA